MEKPTSRQVNTVVTPTSMLPIGVFDSGVGGLTVAAALRQRLPDESLLYLGDLARLPYGTKSPQTVIRYALNATTFLAARGIKMLVIACNTASAHALATLTAAHPELPVLGVVDAGAEAATRLSPHGRITVAATEGTCQSGAFARSILAIRPAARVTQVPCPMFVALAEEGLTEGPIAEDMARHYLSSAFSGPEASDCLILGCTHFPLLASSLRRVLGPAPVMVDCAQAVAARAATVLAERGMAAPQGNGGKLHFATTDAPDRFARIATRLFPSLEGAPEVELVNL